MERAKNRTKSTVRSKVEHVFAVMKLKFGFVKLRYRGLQKNATQLFAVCALVNLYLARKKLLLLAPARLPKPMQFFYTSVTSRDYGMKYIL